MSVSVSDPSRPLRGPSAGRPAAGLPPATFATAPITWTRGYFFSDARRTLQTWLGLVWLLDGALQFQAFMYGRGFISSLQASAVGQPPWIASSVNWAASTMQSEQALLNTMFALVQVAIGIGLLHRRSVRPALAISFVWAAIVWWFGEGFGMLLMPMVSPLAGAPGAAPLYVLIGLIVWPGERPGGLLGVRGARLAWAALWLVMAWLWLQAPGTSPQAVSQAINGAPSGMGWLTSLQEWLVTATAGHGLVIGLALAAASAAIGVAVARNWRARGFLRLSIAINVVFWIAGQGFGGIFTGGATDPNAGPLFVLLACAMYALVPLSA